MGSTIHWICEERRRRIRVGWLLCYICIVCSSVVSSFSSPPRHHHALTTPRRLGGTCHNDSKCRRSITAAATPSSLLLATAPREQGGGSNKNKRKPQDRRFSQTVHHPNAKSNKKKNEFNADRMWRNNKSIEQMEERLAARWGTDLSKWTADDDEDDDEEEWLEQEDVIATDAPRFRATPVRDPWATKEEQEFVRKSSFLGQSSDGADVSIRRAQRNQERLQKAKKSNQANFSAPTKSTSNKQNSVDVGDLIAHRPVGGRGTFQQQAQPPPPPSADSSDDTANKQSTFFFSQSPIGGTLDTKNEEETIQKPKKRERQLRNPSTPILNEKGDPIFLTLQQAEHDFQDFLDTNGKRAVVSDEESEQGILYSQQQPADTKDAPPSSWQDLGITAPLLLDNLEYMGCERPLAVQAKAVPSVVQGKDALVGFYTGSGKTVAFLAPLAQRILSEGLDVKNLQAIIVAPGRELASQIVAVARDLLEGTDISVMLAIGGTGFGRNLEQIRKRKPTILVGTPGRIAELVVGRPGEKGGRLKFGDLQSLVLDEFDALLEYKPHRDPTNAIIQCLKKRRGDRLQSVLCSATASDMLGSPKLAAYLRDGYAVAMADDDDVLVTSSDDREGAGKDQTARVSRTVIHGVVHVPHRRFALETLRRILHTEPLPQQILVFAENSRKVDIIVEKLDGMGIVAAPLHGGRGSEKMDRAEVSKALREGYVGIVIATELAARGLDAPLLTHVINFDLPTDASHYAHRAGRCGRGGRPGVVINLTTSPQERNVPQKFADQLGVTMHAVEPRNGKLNIVEPSSQDKD